MKIIKIVSDKFNTNNYLIVSGEDAILVDGSVFVREIEANLKLCTPKPTLRAVILTHEHFDHINELDNILDKFGCNAYIHENGKKSLYLEEQNMSIIDQPFKLKNKKNVKVFKDGEDLTFGEINVKCYHTPGHSLGSSCFIVNDNMFTGDTVFKVDFGRTDLFCGDGRVLEISLEKVKSLISLADNYYAGHGSNFNKEDLEYNLEHYFGEK